MAEKTQAALLNFQGDAAGQDVTSVEFRAIPVCQWGVYFDGTTREISVASFLERVEELRVARFVEKEELLRSAVD